MHFRTEALLGASQGKQDILMNDFGSQNMESMI